MTHEQKQPELERHRAVLLATLDYLEQHLGGSFVYDQYNPITEYYQQQKIQIEKYFKQRRIDRLQQRLVSLTKRLQNSANLAFAPYIKEQTGYDIDIFEDLSKRVAAIVAQNEIRSQKEFNHIGTMFHYLHETSVNREEVEKLKVLLTNYSKQTNEISGKRKGEYLEVISRVEQDAIEEITIKIFSGPKPKYFEELEATSPDGKRKLRVAQWSDGKHASTYVAVEFPTAGGAVYGTSGICPDIKARWKDNSTIVIETKKEYQANTQHKEVRSFDDVITIEYIEH